MEPILAKANAKASTWEESSEPSLGMRFHFTVESCDCLTRLLVNSRLT